MFNLRFKDIFDLTGTVVTPEHTLAQIIVNTLFALLTGILIYGVYKKTYTGVLFSRNMGMAIILVSVITSIIVVAISGNLALSLGMIGALSIVRFRTPVKDPKDLTFLFWSIANGVICGIAAYKLALVSLVIIGVTLIFLSRGVTWAPPYLLILNLRGEGGEGIPPLLKETCSRFKERSSSVQEDRMEIVYEVVLRGGATSDVLNRLKGLPGVEKALMVSYEGELDETR